jgi:ribosomal protein L29
MGKVRAHEIRGKKKSELLKQVDDLKSELATVSR